MVEGLKDIKPLVTIPDVSLYGFAAAVLFGVLVVGLLAWVLYRAIMRRKNPPLRARVLAKLKSVDTSQSAAAAYAITRYGRFLADDARKKEIFDALERILAPYKYRPDAPALDAEVLRHYQLFVEICDG